jgi:hypothetical protein
LMEFVSSCILLSLHMSCLTNSSSDFSLISILSLSYEILSSTCSSLLEWTPTVFCVYVWNFFLGFSPCHKSFIFNIFYFHF